MLPRHRLGVSLVFVALLALFSASLAAAQSSIYLPLVSNQIPAGTIPPPPSELDDRYDELDLAAATRGEQLFNGQAQCSRCHVPPLYTEPGWNLHTPAEIGIDSFQADRSPDGRYRTAPLKGLWTHTQGGFYHDGRFATLLDVVNHYDAHFELGLNDAQKGDLIEFLMYLGGAP